MWELISNAAQNSDQGFKMRPKLPDLEQETQAIVKDFQGITDRIQTYLDGIVDSTKEQLSIEELALDNMNAAIEAACDQLVKLVAQCDELSKDVDAVNGLKEQISQIKLGVGLLDERV